MLQEARRSSGCHTVSSSSVVGVGMESMRPIAGFIDYKTHRFSVAVEAHRESVEYFLGDISIVFDCGDSLGVITADRVEGTAHGAEADKYPIGSQQKNDAMVRRKHAELAARNKPGGFGVAVADPTVAREALTGFCSGHRGRGSRRAQVAPQQTERRRNCRPHQADVLRAGATVADHG
ncbi:hypothetical protein ACSNN9_18720 [Micromonospora sp. URMC 107]|uniref:hypothetical protein n=1 Tax=Micromonospora sp. URMC 107 TaxID=3423418 RepID=UPI003F1BD545